MKLVRVQQLSFLVALLSAVAHGATYYVATTGNDSSATPTDPATPYKTIDKAMTTAVGGDVISVAAGTYAEKKTFTFNKAVTLTGAGMDKTIVSGCKFSMNHADAVVEDIRIKGWGGAGAVEFAKTGAGGTVRRCDISGNTRTTTDGTGVWMAIGSLIDCVVTNNINGGGGCGVGIAVYPTGDCLIENCLIAENSTGSGGKCGGLYISENGSYLGKRVIVRKTTITRNYGGDTGGLYVYGRNHIVLEDCLVAGNYKLTDATASNTEDAYLGWQTAATASRAITNCLIQKCGTYDAGYQTENCYTNIGAGLHDLYAGDFTVEPYSLAYGHAKDGRDLGYNASATVRAFAAGCAAKDPAGTKSVKTTLVGTVSGGGAGEVTYEWDLDNDGVYEKTGATVEHTFTTVGWNAVRVKATQGSNVSEKTVERVVYVAPETTYVWTQSPNPSFPYATWATAAHEPYTALAAAVDGGTVQLTNEVHGITKPFMVCRRITFAGTGKDNNSVLMSPLHWSLKKYNDVNATGSCIHRSSGDTVLLRLFNTGATVHSIAFACGRSRDLEIYGNSVVSNCVIRYGSYTAGNGCGVLMSAGLVTHCIVSNNYCSNSSTKGVQVSMSGASTLRNCLIRGGLADNTTSPGCSGAIYADGKDVVIENCTICENTAGKGGGIYLTGAGTVRNCIVRDNSALLDAATADICDNASTGVFKNNCLAGAKGEGTVTDPPGFLTDPVTGLCTWTFPAGSKCVNAGLSDLAWITADATDLFGNKRLQGNGIDIGCFEADLSQATCDIEADPAIANAPGNVTFTAKIVGGTLPDGALCIWDFDGDGLYEKTNASVTVFCNEGYHTAKLLVLKDDATLYEVNGKSDLVTIYPKVLYFNAANASGAAFPYNTAATAAATPDMALAAAQDGSEIRVLAGTHDCGSVWQISKAVKLCAESGLATRPKLRRAFDGNVFISVGHADAVVEELDIDGNLKSSQLLSVNAGTVRDCAIRNSYYTSGTGIGLLMGGGLVDRCEIVGNRSYASDMTVNDGGSIIRMSGSAVLRNSLVRGNYDGATPAGRLGGLIQLRGSAVMENCTVTCNTNRQYEVVTSADGGTVRNSLITDNMCGDTSKSGSAWYPSFTPYHYNGSAYVIDVSGVTSFDYNCYTSRTATAVGAHDVLLGDAKFKNAASGDFTVRTTSPAYHAGIVLDWMNSDSIDFGGKPRLWNGSTDIGAFQSQRGSVTLIIQR